MTHFSAPVELDPDRFRHGELDPVTDRIVGEGDVVGSYSADRIGMGQPIRRPFRWKGDLWVCTAIVPGGAEAFRLVDPAVFPGTPTTYPAKTKDAEAARNDPLGFYHGMTTTHAGKARIISGPKTLFIAGPDSEPSLFAALERERSRDR